MTELNKRQVIQGQSEHSYNEHSNNEQQQLLDAIWVDDLSKVDSPTLEPPTLEPSSVSNRSFDLQGINIYRRNLLATAQQALSISFPTVFALLDSDIAEDIVQQYLRVSPPSQGDWTQWGESFADFIATTKVGNIYPYLTDCATVDWCVHCALHGIDQTLVQTSLQVLSDSEPEHIFIEFNQNVKVLKTIYPLTDIFDAHHHRDESQRDIAMKSAQQALLTKPTEQVVMIYRPEFQPKVKTLTDSDGAFMLNLLSGQSLEQSLNIANDTSKSMSKSMSKSDSNFSFEQWLITAIELNLIHYFKEK